MQDARDIKAGVLSKYEKVARSPAGLFRYPTGEESARKLQYPGALVARVPAPSRERFVGVGNPFALGAIPGGAAVLDLGCGAGFDAFLTAELVGPKGRVAGVDLSAEMIGIAEGARRHGQFPQLRFQVADVEALPFSDGRFDVALSNGVLNLVPDKPAALGEIFRVLRPGGRVQACDMSLVADAPPPDKAPWSD